MARIDKAAAMFNRLLINSLDGENLVPMPIKPQMRASPINKRGVMPPNNGRNISPAIRPAIRAFTPRAMARKNSCPNLSMKKRFLPLLILSVSIIILKAIMKQRIRTTTLGKPANTPMKVPPSKDPSQYISPCPAANAHTSIMLRHQLLFLSRLKAVEATQTLKVNDMMKR